MSSPAAFDPFSDPEFLKHLEKAAPPEIKRQLGPRLKEKKQLREALNLQPKQELAEELSMQCDALLFGGSAGGGKALATNTPIPTPNGWCSMEDLKPGDQVFDEKGVVCNVVGATEVMTGRPCFRLRFDDGTEIIADADHQWLTMTNAERLQAKRLTSEFRETRRATRQRRSTGKNPAAALHNQLRTPVLLTPPTGQVRTTRDIASSVTVRGMRSNHSVAVCASLNLPDADLPLDPYVLGAWLGDGTSQSGGFTCADAEILGELEMAGFPATRWPSHEYGYGLVGLKPILRQMGLLNNKHVPIAYLRASVKQRLSLLQGLMDTDGCANQSGSVEFTSSKYHLAEAVVELALSLGHKATLRTGRATLGGRDCGPKYRVKWTPLDPVFRLQRKLERQSVMQRGTQRVRYITSAEPVESVPVKCIQVDSPSHLYLASRAMIPTHNSHWLLVHVTKQMLDYPGNRGVIFRRVFPSLNRTIIPRAKTMLKPWATYNGTDHTFKFHNGSILELATLQYEDAVDDYQGAEYGVVAFEEVTEFLESQVDYFKSRLRAPVDGAKPHLIATTNPGGVGHVWVKREWVKPKPEDVVEGTAEAGVVWKARPKGAEPPMTRCFIPATLDDNPLLLKRDPHYRDRLRSIKDPKKRRAYELGDWDAIEAIDGALWDYEVLDKGRVYTLPTVNRRIVAVDPSEGAAKGDGYGVCVASLGEDGHAYIEWSDEWHDTPAEMAKKTLALYNGEDDGDFRKSCGQVIIEKNHGGKWIPALLKQIQPTVKTKTVWAADGKMTRAEGISALFANLEDQPATVHMVGVHPELEEEMTSYTGKPGTASPDRLDAMVWAITELMLGEIKRGYFIA